MESFEEQARTALAFREHLRDEVCYPTAIGPRHIEYVVSPLEMADGHTPLILNVARDVTERKRAEVAREESERFLRTTLDSLSSHIAILDENGMILAVNEAWRAFARCNDGDLDGVCEGADYFGACQKAQGSDAKTASAVVAGIRTILHGEADTFTLEYPCHSPDTERWFVARATPFSGSGPRRVVVAHETITERKLAEAKLRQREAELAQVSRVNTLGEIAATLAHELNQPLYAINNYVRGIQRRLPAQDASSDWQQVIEAIEQVSKEVERAAGIVAHLRSVRPRT